MNLNDILELVHANYPDEFTRSCWDKTTQRPIHGAGDTLAVFVVAEIADTYDASARTEDQLREASRVMDRAAKTLSLLATALNPDAHESRLQMICARCGSTEVRRDADACWNEATQDWELCAVYDNATCERCEGETQIEENGETERYNPESSVKRAG